MYFIVYKTTNLINGKYYVGIHKCKTLEFDGYYGSGILLNHSINKHGKSRFIRETLFVYDTWDEARDKEREIVNMEFCLMENTYNISIGGTGGNTLAGATAERKAKAVAKMVASNIENGSRIYTGDKLVRAQQRMLNIRIQPENKGRTHTDVARTNMGAKVNGLVWINNGIDSMFYDSLESLPSGWNFGRGDNYKKFEAHSDTSKRKISDANTGYICYNNGIQNLKFKVGITPPEGFAKGMIQNRQPHVWINDGTNSKQLIKINPVPDGWILGRILKILKGTKND